jgi:hypothetical protein
MRGHQFGIIALVGAALLVSATDTWAAFLVYTPVGATAIAELSGDSRLAVDTINGSGLASATPGVINSSADLPTHNQTPQDMWLTDGSTNGTATITFDLGVAQTINALYVWNYAEGSGDLSHWLDRGAKNVDVYADNNANPTTFVQNFIFNKAAPSALTPLSAYNTPVDLYTLSSSITARYIKFDILSSWAEPNYNGNAGPYVGLSEVRLALVPEPSAALLMSVGGLLVSRRKRS